MSDFYTLVPNFKKEITSFFGLQNFVIFKIEDNPNSIPYQIFKALKEKLNMVPISKEKEILGTKCYQKLSEIDRNIQAVIITTNPENTLDFCKECFKNKINNIWIEIGSESKDALDYCKEKNINVIYMHSILKENINPSSKFRSRKDS